MCGRFVSTKKPQELAEYFEADDVRLEDNNFEPNFNVAPQSLIFAIADHHEKRWLGQFKWGLVPSWAKDVSIGNRMINARAESVSDNNAFRSALKSRRCLIPADGFYEWRKEDNTKQPWYFTLKNGEPMAFAGLWEVWHDKSLGEDAARVRSCTIITTVPNEVVEPIHNRMPVLLPATAWDQWLDERNENVDELKKLLVPAPADVMTAWRVSTDVNSAKVSQPSLIDPI